jgi:hypothetical protein
MPLSQVLLPEEIFFSLSSLGRIYKHSKQPLITYEKYNVTDSPKNIGGSHSSPLLKAHGKLFV